MMQDLASRPDERSEGESASPLPLVTSETSDAQDSAQPRGQAASLALIQACLRGDEGAWDALIQRYSSLIYSVALRTGLTDAEAGDVFQEVCLSLWRSLDRLRDQTKLDSWLITVSARLAWQEARQRFHAHFGLSMPEGEAQEFDSSPAEKALIVREDWRALRQAFNRLGERCRRLVWHLFYDPAAPSYAEVAERLAMPLGSIGPVRIRCLQQIRTLLRDAEGGA